MCLYQTHRRRTPWPAGTSTLAGHTGHPVADGRSQGQQGHLWSNPSRRNRRHNHTDLEQDPYGCSQPLRPQCSGIFHRTQSAGVHYVSMSVIMLDTNYKPQPCYNRLHAHWKTTSGFSRPVTLQSNINRSWFDIKYETSNILHYLHGYITHRQLFLTSEISRIVFNIIMKDGIAFQRCTVILKLDP